MHVLAMIAARLAGALVTVVGVSFIVYGALFLAPGSPAYFLTAGKSASPERIAAIEEQYHLNDPFLSQWWQWLSSALRGDLGRSLVGRNDVWALIEPRLGATLQLILLASILTIAYGVLAGIWAGLRKDSLWDHAITTVSSVGLATPTFVLGLVLILVFAIELDWLPVSGTGTGFADRFEHLLLPAIALALCNGAYVSRVTRSAIIEERMSEHVETARIRGLSDGTVVRRHVLRNALIPITTVSGLTVAGLISGTVVVEAVFAINGVGSLLLTAVLTKDFALVQGISLLMVTAFVILNALVDLTYVLIDPRLARQGANA